jgi:hypothetical protein
MAWQWQDRDSTRTDNPTSRGVPLWCDYLRRSRMQATCQRAWRNAIRKACAPQSAKDGYTCWALVSRATWPLARNACRVLRKLGIGKRDLGETARPRQRATSATSSLPASSARSLAGACGVQDWLQGQCRGAVGEAYWILEFALPAPCQPSGEATLPEQHQEGRYPACDSGGGDQRKSRSRASSATIA